MEHPYERNARERHSYKIKALDEERELLFKDTNDKNKKEESHEDTVAEQIERIAERQKRRENMACAAEE